MGQLKFTVYDKDVGGPFNPDDVLGEYTLQSDQFYPQGLMADLPLVMANQKPSSKQEGLLSIQIHAPISADAAFGQPMDQMQMNQNAQQPVESRPLQVIVIAAKNLKDADFIG